MEKKNYQGKQEQTYLTLCITQFKKNMKSNKYKRSETSQSRAVEVVKSTTTTIKRK